MPRATCRCGQVLTFPVGSQGRIVCPGCGAKVKLRPSRPNSSSIVGDGYLRFLCPCGRRLKVPADNPPSHGQCPDCQRVVPVPVDAITGPMPNHPETPTEDLLPTDVQRLEDWKKAHQKQKGALPRDPNVLPLPSVPQSTAEGPVVPRTERGLRICPQCGRPLHLAAETCRHCGTPTPLARK